MLQSEYRKGPLEALVSGVFAASAGVTGKLALDLESRDIVVGLCRPLSDSALLAIESQFGIFPALHFDVCGSAEVREHSIFLILLIFVIRCLSLKIYRFAKEDRLRYVLVGFICR
jgi:hypothetical protein